MTQCRISSEHLENHHSIDPEMICWLMDFLSVSSQRMKAIHQMSCFLGPLKGVFSPLSWLSCALASAKVNLHDASHRVVHRLFKPKSWLSRV